MIKLSLEIIQLLAAGHKTWRQANTVVRLIELLYLGENVTADAGQDIFDEL